MYSLYQYLENGLPAQDEKYLVHELIHILENISSQAFKLAMKILYGETFYVDKNPGQLANMFVVAMKKSEFFSFAYFMKELRGNPK